MNEQMIEKAEGLRRLVRYELDNGKESLTVDLHLLDAIFSGNIPVGNNVLPPEELTSRFYEVRGDRDKFRRALEQVLVPTNFISLEAARDYISEVLGVGIYAERKGE